MDGMREWRIRHRPELTVVAVGIGVGLVVLGLALAGNWAIVRALAGAKVAPVGLWYGVLAAGAGGMLTVVAFAFPPAGQTKEGRS